MLELIDGLALYHGSYCEVTMPDLNKCARYKDFGIGFYLTTSKKQAESFAGISTRKAVANGIVPTEQRYGVVSSFKVMFEGELDVHIYNEADADWLHCIVGHRKKKAFPEIVEKLKACDVIAGKIADDNTNATITAYMVEPAPLFSNSIYCFVISLRSALTGCPVVLPVTLESISRALMIRSL